MLAEVLEGGNSGHYSEKNRVKDESFGRRKCTEDVLLTLVFDTY